MTEFNTQSQRLQIHKFSLFGNETMHSQVTCPVSDNSVIEMNVRKDKCLWLTGLWSELNSVVFTKHLAK